MPHPYSAACSSLNRRCFRHAIGGARNNIIQGSYTIDSTKLQTQLHWHPATPFEQGIEKTVRWYLGHRKFMVKSMSSSHEPVFTSEKNLT